MDQNLIKWHAARQDRFKLVPEFRERIDYLVVATCKMGLELRLGTGLRHPQFQADMWCSSRTAHVIQRRIDLLTKAGAPTLASLLSTHLAGSVPYETTEHLPGQSWHQWGMAADLYFIAGNTAQWSGSLFRAISTLIKSADLIHQTNHETLTGKPHHVQLHRHSSAFDSRQFLEGWADAESRLLHAFGIPTIEPTDIEEQAWHLKDTK